MLHAVPVPKEHVSSWLRVNPEVNRPRYRVSSPRGTSRVLYLFSRLKWPNGPGIYNYIKRLRTTLSYYTGPGTSRIPRPAPGMSVPLRTLHFVTQARRPRGGGFGLEGRVGGMQR